MRYRIEGAWRESGEDGCLTIDAASERDARAAANGMGLVVGKVGTSNDSTRVHLAGAGAPWGLCAAVLVLALVVGAQTIMAWQREQEARHAMENASAAASASLAESKAQLDKAMSDLTGPDAEPLSDEARAAEERAAKREVAKRQLDSIISFGANFMDSGDASAAAIELSKALPIIDEFPNIENREQVWSLLATAWQRFWVNREGRVFDRPTVQLFDQSLRFDLRYQEYLDQTFGPMDVLSIRHGESIADRIGAWSRRNRVVIGEEVWLNSNGLLTPAQLTSLAIELRGRRRQAIEALLPILPTPAP